MSQNPPWQWNFWIGDESVDRLDLFRRIFAFAAIIYFAFWFLNWREWLTADGFRLTPDVRLYYHFRPLPPLPVWLVPILGTVLFSSLAGILLGWRPHLLVWPLLVCLGYVHGVDVTSAFTLNKFFFVFFFVIALSGARATGTVSSWPTRIIQATLLIQYATAGWCKVLHGDWIEHPDCLWTQVQGSYRTEIAAYLLRVLPLEAWTLQMYASLVYEVLAPLLFMVPRLRVWGMIGGILFHGGIALTMHQLFFFSFQMVIIYILFFPPNWVDFVRKKLRLPSTAVSQHP